MGMKELGAYFQLGEKLKNARKTSGQSQKDFASALGVPASTYSNYENGNRIPSTGVLSQVSAILKMSIHDLISANAINDPVNHPAHYTTGKIEVIDFIDDKGLGFCLGNAVKYIARAGKKDPVKTVEDLQKAVWYINHHIEALKKEASADVD